jgi:hypothetical protein
MTERDLERMIGDWYRRDSARGEELRALPSADCPPLTRLWQHHAEGRPLDEHEHHVERCDRCRRLRQIIERQHAPSTTTTVTSATALPGRSRAWLFVAGPTLAAAACLALFVVSWSQPDLDANVAVFAERAYLSFGATPMRGDEGEAATEGDEADPAWLARMLADPAVVEAITVQGDGDASLALWTGKGLVHVDRDGRLTMASDIEDLTTRTRVATLIDENRRATEQIVDALMRYLPGASQKDRPTVQRSVNRWRAKNVF